MTTVYYLKLQGYATVVPLSAVRYTVKIAKNENIEQKDTEKLIKEIAQWLKNHSGKSRKELDGKIALYVNLPYRILTILHKIGFKGYVENKIREWLAFDIYPEYEKEVQEIIDFVHLILNESTNIFDDDNNLEK